MICGEFRRHFPRVWLELPGQGGTEPVEFVLDTGFEGELAIPASILRRLDAQQAGREFFALAGEDPVERSVYELLLSWNGEERIVQVVGLEGNSLLGTLLLEGNEVSFEVIEGGDVVVEPL